MDDSELVKTVADANSREALLEDIKVLDEALATPDLSPVELKRVKATDAREITRLKKELETVRAVLRDYVMQIDSLNRLNENLMAENTRVNAELEQRTAQVAGLSSEKASLSEKVAIAAQLDAAAIH